MSKYAPGVVTGVIAAAQGNNSLVMAMPPIAGTLKPLTRHEIKLYRYAASIKGRDLLTNLMSGEPFGCSVDETKKIGKIRKAAAQIGVHL